MLCASGRPLRVSTWLAVPFLFGSAVLGLTGLAGLLVGAPRDIALSSPLFGASVAVGAAGSGMVAWRAAWQQVWLRWGYPTGLFGVGIAVDGVRLPVVGVVAVGIPVVVLLVAQYVSERRRTAESSDEQFAAGRGCQ
ncbi:hypothetical protein ABZ816_42380 [Actinosynnema sp. NPDC047251]|uniref:Uncharacterized protein n=1 Tax=Saccharothrix espanaensis (strain ATCC 51144 / DSM 44229 / JCM 9112 / NBRC 15066 / NRRL 15764) TaxID=1179773 RepID=K0KAS6_SACES|nr:hypothetical protein [Saccharothrix espanaensis]CCH34597.1 hypothetical protein BN6_73660 [Saccharothrix espanaensis DSM 44229]